MVDLSSNCVCVCVVGPQNWMRWCLVTSSPYSPPDWPAQSWQRGSRATATCCPSADASNRVTLKTRALERRKIAPLYYLSYILPLPRSFPRRSTETLETAGTHALVPFDSCFSFLLIHACTLLHAADRSPEEQVLLRIKMSTLHTDEEIPGRQFFTIVPGMANITVKIIKGVIVP